LAALAGTTAGQGLENENGGKCGNLIRDKEAITMYSLGIDIGYSSIKMALIDESDKIQYAKYVLHRGRVKEGLKNSLYDLAAKIPLADIRFGAVTGSGGKWLTAIGAAQSVNEVAAIVEGSAKTHPEIRSIIEIGGQSAKYITEFSANDKSRIEIGMNSNCSAGTGSFLEEQMSRLNLKLEDYSVYAARAKSIPRIAGRCSVFAKTDITHHQQEGVAVEDILLGLAYAVIRNYQGAVIKKLPLKKPILFIGGVAHNQGVITAFNDVLNLAEGELIVPEYFSQIEAAGAALIAKNEGLTVNLGKLITGIEEFDERAAAADRELELPPLRSFGEKDSLDKHGCPGMTASQELVDCFLGVDVGSTSTNLVLMNAAAEIIGFKYLRTFGNPIEAVKTGLKGLRAEFGDRVRVIGAGTTGSGRYMIGELIGADVIKDEITSQARAAVALDGSVDTIFEIGGQDSKYISLEDGVVTDFQMNKICAAGTGSFIEEQAKKFNIPIGDFGEIALRSNGPIPLGERCTVFIETSIAAQLAGGAEIEDIASGLCYSIVKNYLDKVVGQKKIGNKIFFQGGVAYNQGVVNAFRALTGKTITVPPFFSVTGAYGVAILTQEALGNAKTKFKGFDLEVQARFVEERKENRFLKNETNQFNQKVAGLIFAGYDGVIDPGRKTVGIPRALFAYGMFPMFNAFFKELGFNVLLSDPTHEETIRLGQQYSLDETCYPVKLITGHVAELVAKKVDYIFFPDLYSVDHPGSHTRQNYGCAYMQLAFKLMNQAMELEKRGIQLLTPTIAFSLGREFMIKSFQGLGEKLGKSPEQTARALQEGMRAFHDFEARIGANGKKVIQELRPDEKGFVLISKIYGVADPVLNLGIPGKLMAMGYQGLPFYDLPEGDISQEHPNMYWPFGQHILEPAQLMKEHPNLYAIFLTHHGCGPDSAFSHYFREAMAGKPYLHIEVDEHSSGVGVITRVEAFVNSLNKGEAQKAETMETYRARIVHQPVNIKHELAELRDGTTLYLPYLYPYAEILKDIFVRQGINAKVLPQTSKVSIDTGRKFTITEEYFALTALLGDVFHELKALKPGAERITFWIPQSEGAEVDGQYHRVLRTKLDEEGFKYVDIIAPFIEDLFCKDEAAGESIFLSLLAGDIMRVAHPRQRNHYLQKTLDLVKADSLKIGNLKEIAKAIAEELATLKSKKRILAIGESLVLFNDMLNNFTFTKMEAEGHRVIYSSMSESLWMIWRDYLDQNASKSTERLRCKLVEYQKDIREISECLAEESPFERDLEDLVTRADNSIGYYAGANGRYRAAKPLGDLQRIDGIVTVASMYENTGIVLNVLHKGFAAGHLKPVLHLTFDGNNNENDETKIQSFLYYI
jgi:predicted CoA-substrate-specific enzyme activase